MSDIAETLLDRVPTAARGGPDWLAALRASAASALRETGFPHKKVEDWRFTPVDPVVRVPFAHAPTEPPTGWRDLAERQAAGDDATPIILANGRPVDAPPEVSGVQIQSLAEALEADPEGVGAHLGRCAPTRYFAGLNAALFDDGLVIRVRRGQAVTTPLHIVHVTAPTGDPTAAYPRILVVAEPGSELRLVETYAGAEEGPKHLTSAVTEVSVGGGAVVDHLRVVQGSPVGYHLADLSVRQEGSSSYTSRSVALGGALTRLDLSAVMEGEGASCTLDGVYHVGGTEHVDHHTFVDHAEPRCSSRETYRGLLDGRGHAVFDGTMRVAKHAQQSAAHQENRNLLLSDDATIHTKPHLQIDADDVSCSHGATIGSLDPDALFYLRSRGLRREHAEAVLTYAFVKEVVDRIPHAASRERIARALRARLPHGESTGDFE